MQTIKPSGEKSFHRNLSFIQIKAYIVPISLKMDGPVYVGRPVLDGLAFHEGIYASFTVKYRIGSN